MPQRCSRDYPHESIFANTVVRWDRLCAAILWRNGRVRFSFLVYTISKNALECLTDANEILGGLNPRHRVEVMTKIDSYRADGRRIA